MATLEDRKNTPATCVAFHLLIRQRSPPCANASSLSEIELTPLLSLSHHSRLFSHPVHSFSGLKSTAITSGCFILGGILIKEVLQRLRRYSDEDRRRKAGEKVPDRGVEGWAMGEFTSSLFCKLVLTSSNLRIPLSSSHFRRRRENARLLSLPASMGVGSVQATAELLRDLLRCRCDGLPSIPSRYMCVFVLMFLSFFPFP